MVKELYLFDLTDVLIHILVEGNEDTVNQTTDLEDLGEEEMLMRAIAMSLEKEEPVAKEELGSIDVEAPGEVQRCVKQYDHNSCFSR